MQRTMKAVVSVLAYVVLSWGIAASGGEASSVVCEVDNPHGACVSGVETCLEAHRGEQCDRDYGHNVDGVSPIANPPVCDKQSDNACNIPGWHVGSKDEAARCDPDEVKVTFHHFSADLYIVEVQWVYEAESCGHLEQLLGVQVLLDGAGLRCSDDSAGGWVYNDCCYCITTDGQAQGSYNITVLYDNSDQASVKVSSFPQSNGNADYTTEKVFNRFMDCYDSDGPNDEPRLPPDLERCGVPNYGEPTNIQITSYLSPDNDYEMSATLTWDPPAIVSTYTQYPSPTDHYVRVRANQKPDFRCGSAPNDTLCFRVTNSSRLTFHHLNPSDRYYVGLEAYGNCVGRASPYYMHGCGAKASAWFMKPTYSSVSSALPTASPSPVATTRTSTNTSSLVIGLSVGLTGLVLITVCVLLCAVACIVKRRRSRVCHTPFCAVIPTEITTRIWDSDTGPGRLVDECTGEPVYRSTLVVYSDNSPELEKTVICAHLIAGLRENYSIDATCHECFVGGDLVVQIANKIEEVDAVLCVCNPAFYNDWKSERPTPVINVLKQRITGDVTWGGTLEKFAVVFLNVRDKDKCIPDQFLRVTKCFLVDELNNMALFINKTPPIAFAPV